MSATKAAVSALTKVGLQGPAGPKGDTGATGATGPKGDAGSTGPQGIKGDTGAVGATGPQGVKGDTGAQGAIGPQGPKGDTGPAGTNASPSLQFVGNLTVNKTLILALSSGMTREDFTLSGITTADQGKLVISPRTPCSAGCEAINIYAKAANTVTLSYNTPALAIGAVINMPLAVYRIV